MADDDNPLIKALPPETDYISYLTILEYNLTAERLPTLHNILQDQTLTANIGWDLVHLLLPLLPASQQCLQDVSRLGNPREVVLKVTELLGGLSEEDDEDREDEESGNEDGEEGEKEHKKLEDLRREDIEVTVHDGMEIAPTYSHSPTANAPISPSKALKYTTLLEMLAILHPRIKTKYPSRFLSTSLQAVLPAYMQVAKRPETTEAVLGFIKDLSGTKRPKLPPRKSSTAILTQSTPQSAPDPEGKDEALGADEAGLQSRLLQSFLTYVTEGYMTSLASDENVPGMAWCSRYQEKLHPEKLIPGRKTYSNIYAEEENLHERDTVMGHILALSRDLKITAEELLVVITKPEELDVEEDEELPSAASDVPLSRTGSLCLLATMAASSTFFDAPDSLPPVHLLPEFAAILGSSLGDSATGSTGAEPEPLIDAVLFLGFLILNNQEAVALDNDQVYNNILQRLSLLSANMPSPVLRYHAHLLTCSILHLHPSDNFRLAFIKDTLEHCPYENLKASAVGWLKDEFLAADKSAPENASEVDPSMFATSAALDTLSPFLLPNADAVMEGQSLTNSYATFQAHQPFYLAVLNLLYLLLSSPSLSSRLGLATSAREDPEHFSKFLDPLMRASNKFRESIASGEIGYGDEEGQEAALAGLELMEMSVQQVNDVIARIK